MLVDKIQNYLDGNGGEIPEEILRDVSFLAAQSFSRQFGPKKETAPSLRLSSVGRCVRQQAYTLLGFEKNGKEIDARAKMVFFQGDIAELAIVQLMRVAGLDVKSCQEELSLYEVKGHPDGIYTSPEGKKYLLEVKSMSSYSFGDFQNGNIDEGYLFQINAYLEALGLDDCVMVGLNKDAGVLHEHVVRKNPSIIARIQDNIFAARAATKYDLPSRPYSPDEKGFFPWQCLYCAYRTTCLPDAELVLVKNKYKLRAKQ